MGIHRNMKLGSIVLSEAKRQNGLVKQDRQFMGIHHGWIENVHKIEPLENPQVEDSSILLGDGMRWRWDWTTVSEVDGECRVLRCCLRSARVPLNGHYLTHTGARISLTLPEYLLQKHVCPRPFQAEVTLCQKPSNHKPPDIWQLAGRLVNVWHMPFVPSVPWANWQTLTYSSDSVIESK